MFINKLKTKKVFLQNGFKYKKNSQLLLKKISPQELKKSFKSCICRQENAAAVRSLRAKIVIVDNSNELKIIFLLNYLTVLVHT